MVDDTPEEADYTRDLKTELIQTNRFSTMAKFHAVLLLLVALGVVFQVESVDIYRRLRLWDGADNRPSRFSLRSLDPVERLEQRETDCQDMDANYCHDYRDYCHYGAGSTNWARTSNFVSFTQTSCPRTCGLC